MAPWADDINDIICTTIQIYPPCNGKATRSCTLKMLQGETTTREDEADRASVLRAARTRHPARLALASSGSSKHAEQEYLRRSDAMKNATATASRPPDHPVAPKRARLARRRAR